MELILLEEGLQNIFPHNPMNDLLGKVVKARAVEYKPLFHQIKMENGTIKEVGVQVDMVKTLTDSINANLEIDLPTSGTWGENLGKAYIDFVARFY